MKYNITTKRMLLTIIEPRDNIFQVLVIMCKNYNTK